MEKRDKKYMLNFIIGSLGYIALGLMMLLVPEHSKRIICYLMGCVGIVLGILRIVWYFAKDDVARAFHNDIPLGIVMLIAGIYLMARPDALWDWLPVLLGFAIVFDSIVKLQHAFDLKRTGFGPWWGVLGVALATGTLGLLLILGIVSQNILLYFFAFALLIDGVVNLVTVLLLWRRMPKGLPPGGDEGDEPPMES